MLKGRHRYGAGAGPAPRRSAIAPPEVGIVPGNRILLLPLKKVSALVRHHDYRCRGASATSTKTCIESKARAATPTTPNPVRAVRSPSSTRSTARQRRRHHHPAIAKTRLGPISEQDEGTIALLTDPGTVPCTHATIARVRKQNLERAENARRINTLLYFRKAGDSSHQSAPASHPGRRRAKGTSIFSLDQPEGMQRRARFSAERAFVSELVETALKQEGMGAAPRRRKKGAFGRNRVSPSEHVVSCEAVKSLSSVRCGDESFGGCSRGGGDLTWWRGRGCSLAHEDDLPIGPLRRRSTLRELLLK